MLFLSSISKFPGVLSSHTTYALLPDTSIAGDSELPESLLRLTVLPKEAPPSVLFLRNISVLPGVKSSHTRIYCYQICGNSTFS